MRGLMRSMLALLRDPARHPRRRRDRPRHRVVPQPPVRRLQDRRGHPARPVGPVPARRGRAARARHRRLADGRVRGRRRPGHRRRPLRRRVDQVVILSPDKDLAQCVAATASSPTTACAARRYDEAGVRAKFGVPPASIPDCSRWSATPPTASPASPAGARSRPPPSSPPTATSKPFPIDPGRWTVAVRGRDRLAAALAARRAEAQLYKTLATLRRDVPLAEHLAELRWAGVPRAAIEALCASLGFADLATARRAGAAQGGDPDPGAGVQPGEPAPRGIGAPRGPPAGPQDRASALWMRPTSRRPVT